MSGGKGGSTSSTVEIPQYIEDAARRNLARADTISKIGYVPYYGPDVAAFTPMQEAAFQNTADVASAFGTAGGGMSQQGIMGGMSAPTTYAGGVRGYSSAPMYEESMAELATRRPGQKALIDSLFIDPYSGVAGSNVGPLVDYASTATPGDLGGGSVGGGGDLVSYPGSGVPGGGNGSALSDAEIDRYSQVIADELGMDSFDPTRTAESQMTPEQYAEYQSQSMSNPAQLAADNIYMNNLATSGQGSLATGGMTGTTLGGDVAAGLNAASNLPGVTGLLANEAAEAMAPRNVYRDTDNSNRTAMETQLDYQAAQRAADLASGAIPAFDANDPSTWTTASGQNAQQAFGNTYTNTYSGGFESRPSHATDNDNPEIDAYGATRVYDPVSGKTLARYQIANRMNSGAYPEYAEYYAKWAADEAAKQAPPGPPPQVIRN